jgi:hypothetical protein
MSDQGASGASTDTDLVSEAYTTARQLLRQAEDDATRIRADADRYMRQREQEAELLVGKARRLLALAEEKAAAPRPVMLDVDAPPLVHRWDLEVPAVAFALDDAGAPIRAGSLRTRSDLDSILAAAVSNAIHRALPADD